MATSDTREVALTGPARFVYGVFGFRPAEFAAAAWSFTYFFCVLGSYYMLRPVRESLAAESPEAIPYLFTSTFLTMLAATPVFGWIASRYPRRTFLPWVYVFFVLNILAFWIAFSFARDRGLDYVWLSRVFFVWISVFNLYVVSVLWSFMADVFSREQSRRLFGFISAGGSIGAMLGGIATRSLVVEIGFENMMPIAAATLMMSVLCITRLRRWVETEQSGEITNTFASGRALGGSPFAGITQVFQSKYFMAIVAKSVIASLLGTALYMFTAELAQVQFENADERTRFFSDINVAINALALIGQLLVVRHVVVRFGIGVSLSLLPVVSLIGFTILAFEPTLAAVAILTVVRRSLGFGFSKPTSDMLYSVVTPEQKYKAKNFIDTVVYRGGDVIGTWTIRLMQVFTGMAGVSVLMLPFAAMWGGIAIWLGRDYRRRAEELKSNA